MTHPASGYEHNSPFHHDPRPCLSLGKTPGSFKPNYSIVTHSLSQFTLILFLFIQSSKMEPHKNATKHSTSLEKMRKPKEVFCQRTYTINALDNTHTLAKTNTSLALHGKRTKPALPAPQLITVPATKLSLTTSSNFPPHSTKGRVSLIQHDQSAGTSPV